MIYNELKQHGTEDFPIELYHIEKNHTRYEMATHWHSEIEIIRVLSGVLNVRLNNHSYKVKESEIIFINPETVHQASPENCIYECIVFNLDLISSMKFGCYDFSDALKNHEYVVNEHHTDTESSFYKAADSLFKTLSANSPGYKLKVTGALATLFGEIIDAHLYRSTNGMPLATDKNVPKLRSVLSFIRSNYASAITLGDMASAAGMSPKYFCYFFKQMTSKTPVEYLMLYRIEKASRKLIHSDLSVTQIAFSCGFNDLSYFIKTFKDTKGITPAKFRREALSTL